MKWRGTWPGKNMLAREMSPQGESVAILTRDLPRRGRRDPFECVRGVPA
jgi:hypothetical protein